jgi:putative oxidoreductase
MRGQTWFLALAGRVLIALIFIWSGVAKALTFESTTALIAHAHLPMPEVAWLIAIILEGGCGLLLLVGFQVRWAAVVLAIFCLITAFAFHSDLSNPLQFANFVKNFLIVGGLLNLAHFGAGAFSFDTRRSPKAAQGRSSPLMT